MSRTLCAALFVLVALLAIAPPASAQTTGSTTIVISEFRTRGPVGGNDEFVELRNVSSQPVNIGGYSLQGCASSGGNPSNRATVPAGVSLAPGQAYLFVNNNASGGYSGLVAGDQTYGTGFTDFATGNQSGIRIVDSGGAVIDGVGSPSSPCREGSGLVTPTANGDNSFERAGGATDTNNNLPDFQGPKPGNQQNRSTTAPPAADEPPAVTSTDPPNGAIEVGPNSNIAVTFSEPVNATRSSFEVTCNGTNVPVTVTSNEPGTIFTLDPDQPLPRGAECTVRVIAAEVTDRDTQDPPNNPAADHTFSFTTERITGLRIHDVQGRQHLSPYRDFLVGGVPGVVTAVRQTGSRGFYLQDPSADSDLRTSEGIFVFVGGSRPFPPEVRVGETVVVSGQVQEFRGGCFPSCTPPNYDTDPVQFGSNAFDHLTLTEIVSPQVAAGPPASAIAPTVVGRGGRVPPRTVIDDDTPDPQTDDPPLVSGNVEDKSSPPGVVEPQDPTFDPDEDGIDFYESLEGMLTEVRDAVAVQPTTDFGVNAGRPRGTNSEIPVLADRGKHAGLRTRRGGIVARAFDLTLPQEYRLGDFNPERIILNDPIARERGQTAPPVDVRDRFREPVRAVVDYSFGNFKFLALGFPDVRDGKLRPEVTHRQNKHDLAVATYNVENLDPVFDAERIQRIAGQIVDNLRSPDILGLQEVQDNNGESAGDSNGDATFKALVKAIADAGGPTYDYRHIDPANNEDGGVPNGNIRVGFLFRPDRGVQFVDRGVPSAASQTEPAPGPDGAQLTISPGRIEPASAVWRSSRKPLAGEFRFRGEKVFVVANHLNSKGGDDSLFGRFQEPKRPTELQRRGSTQPGSAARGQAGVINAWVRRLLDIQPRASVIVLGDLNDFDFSETLRVLERGGETDRNPELFNLWRLLPEKERYSYIFEGNSQTLDHILVSPSLLRAKPGLDPVHINAEFFEEQQSDHDPLVSRLAVHEDDEEDDEGSGSHEDDEEDEDDD